MVTAVDSALDNMTRNIRRSLKIGIDRHVFHLHTYEPWAIWECKSTIFFLTDALKMDVDLL